MTNPIDKVARAIKPHAFMWDRYEVREPPWAEREREEARGLAIAALRAIREPTEEMVTAMSDALTDDSAFSSDSKQTWTQVAQLIGISAFQAAIDKALEANPNTGREG